MALRGRCGRRSSRPTWRREIETRRQAELLVARPEPERLAVAEAVLDRWPVPVRFDGPQACCPPALDQIQLPRRAAFHSAVAWRSAAPWPITAYLGHWVELLRESPRVLFQVLSDARRAADLICPEPADPQPAGSTRAASEPAAP